MANAKEKKEIVENHSKEVAVEKINLSVDVTIEKGIFETNDNETIEEDLFFGCGSDGNAHYAIWRDQGQSHRAARRLRRAWVQNCRGGAWGWPWNL